MYAWLQSTDLRNSSCSMCLNCQKRQFTNTHFLPDVMLDMMLDMRRVKRFIGFTGFFSFSRSAANLSKLLCTRSSNCWPLAYFLQQKATSKFFLAHNFKEKKLRLRLAGCHFSIKEGMPVFWAAVQKKNGSKEQIYRLHVFVHLCDLKEAKNSRRASCVLFLP